MPTDAATAVDLADRRAEVVADDIGIALAALRRVSGMPHAKGCDGYGSRLVNFKCACHVRKAKNAIQALTGEYVV